ncbi:hypothetical protein ABVT39_006261 [Epinephelus coioides]
MRTTACRQDLCKMKVDVGWLKMISIDHHELLYRNKNMAGLKTQNRHEKPWRIYSLALANLSSGYDGDAGGWIQQQRLSAEVRMQFLTQDAK